MKEEFLVRPVACVDCVHFEVKIIFGYCKLGKFFPLSVVSSLPFAFIKRCPDFEPKKPCKSFNFSDLVEKVVNFQKSYRNLLRKKRSRKNEHNKD